MFKRELQTHLVFKSYWCRFVLYVLYFGVKVLLRELFLLKTLIININTIFGNYRLDLNIVDTLIESGIYVFKGNLKILYIFGINKRIVVNKKFRCNKIV